MLCRNNRILALLCILLIVPCFSAIAQNKYGTIPKDSLVRTLKLLDEHIAKKDIYIQNRHNYIDSLKTCFTKAKSENEQLSLIMKIAGAYTSFDNDSAIQYYNRGIELAPENQRAKFQMKKAAILPLNGGSKLSINIIDSINPDLLSNDDKRTYYDSSRQAYSFISSFYEEYPEISQTYALKSNEAQAKLIELLPHETPYYKLNVGESFYHSGQLTKAFAVLDDLMNTEPVQSNLRARAAHLLSQIARQGGDNDLWLYYLIQSAISDVTTATLEVASLQDLGINLYNVGDIDRAYAYLSTALENAVQCKASMRMIQTAKALPVIEKAYSERIDMWIHRIYFVIALLIVLMCVLVCVMFYLRKEMIKLKALKIKLSGANKVKEVYISRFLSLCSIYMDKLSQLTKIVERKISSGKAEELLRMIRSGKFVEEQSKDFYEVFDDAFLHLYPNFVEQVNKLLLPDKQIVLKNGELLNTDLRILAFMRMGIEDSSSISQVLNYSLNTIYNYRNRLKNKAINRDTFEQDVINIPGIEE